MAKMSMAKPMSFSAPRITMENPQARMIGSSGRGSRTSRLPKRADGMLRSSFLSARYEAKKMASRILATSTGWN